MQPEWNDEEGGHIRLMIVDDVPDTAENVINLLYFERDIEVVATAHSGRDAIAKAVHFAPDIILMDINMPDLDCFRAAEAILQQVPTRIIIMSVQAEQEYFKRALAAGARDYLIKPFSGDELINTLHRVAQIPVQRFADAPPGAAGFNGQAARSGVMDSYPAGGGYGNSPPPRMRQRVVTVFSGKGGVGRSVIALNLAILLRQMTGERVALVDANLQSGDIHILLGTTASSSLDDLLEAESLDAQIINQVMATHDSGLQVLRAPSQAESAELYNAEQIKRIFSELRENFDYLIVDMSPSYSDVNLTLLEMADQILLVTTLEITSLNKVTRFFEVAERLGFPEQKILLVCNRVESYYGIKPQQLEGQVRHAIAAQLPEEVELMVSSVNRGIPMVLQVRNHPFTKQLTLLARQVAGEALPGEPVGRNGARPAKRRGLFGSRR
jgi:pilus assembly protein CpaE